MAGKKKTINPYRVSVYSEVRKTTTYRVPRADFESLLIQSGIPIDRYWETEIIAVDPNTENEIGILDRDIIIKITTTDNVARDFTKKELES